MKSFSPKAIPNFLNNATDFSHVLGCINAVCYVCALHVYVYYEIHVYNVMYVATSIQSETIFNFAYIVTVTSSVIRAPYESVSIATRLFH